VSLNKSTRQLTRNIFSLTVVQIATYVLPLISVPVISRIIGPDKYGIINFGAAFVAYFTLIITYSFDFTATRKLAKKPNDTEYRNLVFSEVFYTQCILFTVSTIIFVILLFTVSELKSNQIVMAFSYLLCVSILFTQNWLFQAMQDLSKVAIFNLLSKVLFTVALLIFVRKNEDYIWQPFIIGIIQMIVAIWSFFWAIKKYKIKLIRLPLIKSWQVIVEERIIFFSLVCVSLYTYTNTVILGFFQSAEQVGYYTSAQRLIIIAQSVLTMPLAISFYPFIGKAFGESKESGLRVAQKLIPLIVIVIGIASIGMFLLGPFVIRMFYGSKFEASIPIFQIITIIPLFAALNNVLGVQIMLNMSMDKVFLRISASAGALSVILNLLTVRRWGNMATTFNWLFIEAFLFMAMFFVLKSKGLNPINLQYFKFSSMRQYIEPVRAKFFNK
jgi:O-antigen/teichoic acid export membrane protein